MAVSVWAFYLASTPLFLIRTCPGSAPAWFDVRITVADSVFKNAAPIIMQNSDTMDTIGKGPLLAHMQQFV